MRKVLLVAAAMLPLLSVSPFAATAAEEEAAGETTVPEVASSEKSSSEKQDNPVKVTYHRGIRVESADGNYSAKFNFRAQFRLTDISSPDLVGEEDGVEEESGFLIRRARIKASGHAYRPWLKYKFEYGLAGNILLTYRFGVDRYKQVGFNVGQYKIYYNRERLDSSGKQQFVDRSIVNSPFTVDRQQGVDVHGRLFEGSRGDSNYWAGAYTGTGRGGELDGDRRPMYLGRWQWNYLKRVLPFSQSDIKRREKPAASIALAASSNVSQYTRFSSSGGGQLPGFSDGVPGQYKIEQWMAEFAHQGNGFSAQAEFHRKRIEDRVNDQISALEGWYAQVGYFFNGVWEKFPKPLEMALRFARVDSTTGIEIPADREATLALNWFFYGHDNKLTFDVSRLKSTGELGTEDDGWRARLQWDISY